MMIYAIHKDMLVTDRNDTVDFIIRYYDVNKSMYIRTRKDPNHSEDISNNFQYSHFLTNIEQYLKSKVWVKISKDYANQICKQWYEDKYNMKGNK